MQCPNNACLQIWYDLDNNGNIITRLAYFAANTNDEGAYYAYWGPGSRFYDAGDAAIDFLDMYSKEAIAAKREYGVAVYCNASGVCSYTYPNIGPLCLRLPCSVEIPSDRIPSGSTLAADAHIHTYWTVIQNFSTGLGGDLSQVMMTARTHPNYTGAYLATPMGWIWFFDGTNPPVVIRRQP